jgi:hypothetical protein
MMTITTPVCTAVPKSAMNPTHTATEKLSPNALTIKTPPVSANGHGRSTRLTRARGRLAADHRWPLAICRGRKSGGSWENRPIARIEGGAEQEDRRDAADDLGEVCGLFGAQGAVDEG